MTEPTPLEGILDNRVFQQMAQIATCLCAQIQTNGLPTPCFCGIIAGAEPYDATGIGECDDDANGQAWIRLMNAYPSDQVGVALITPGNCGGHGFGYDLEVGILRNIRIEENGGALPANEMLEAVQYQVADMLTMQQALECCAVDNEDFVMGQYLPIGPDAGLVGGSWQISIGII